MAEVDGHLSGTNTVTLHSDYIEAVWYGRQTPESIRGANEKILAASEQLVARHQPVLLSVDIRIGEYHSLPHMAAYDEVVKLFRAVTFDRVVVSGKLPAVLRPLLMSIIGGFNRQMAIKYVVDPDEAKAWLKSTAQGDTGEESGAD